MYYNLEELKENQQVIVLGQLDRFDSYVIKDEKVYVKTKSSDRLYDVKSVKSVDDNGVVTEVKSDKVADLMSEWLNTEFKFRLSYFKDDLYADHKDKIEEILNDQEKLDDIATDFAISKTDSLEDIINFDNIDDIIRDMLAEYGKLNFNSYQELYDWKDKILKKYDNYFDDPINQKAFEEEFSEACGNVILSLTSSYDDLYRVIEEYGIDTNIEEV